MLNILVAVLLFVGIMALGIVLTRAMSARRIGDVQRYQVSPLWHLRML